MPAPGKRPAPAADGTPRPRNSSSGSSGSKKRKASAPAQLAQPAQPPAPSPPLRSALFLAPRAVPATVDLCAHCFSPGAREGPDELVACATCAEVYHAFCAFPPDGSSYATKRHKLLRHGWRCMACLLCTVCHESAPEDQLLVCDSCERGFHTFCLRPPLAAVPTDSWMCNDCVACVRCGHVGGGHEHFAPGSKLCRRCTAAPADDATCGVCTRGLRMLGIAVVECTQCHARTHAHCAGLDRSLLELVLATGVYVCAQCRIVVHAASKTVSPPPVPLNLPMRVCASLDELDEHCKPTLIAPSTAAPAATADNVDDGPHEMDEGGRRGAVASGSEDEGGALGDAAMTCALCGLAVGAELGRLLVASKTAFVHAACALWSPRVTCGNDGWLHGVKQTLTAARRTRCYECKRFGATLACAGSACPRVFHLPCAVSAPTQLASDRTVRCARHPTATLAEPWQKHQLMRTTMPLRRVLHCVLSTDHDPPRDWLRAGALTIVSLGESGSVPFDRGPIKLAMGFTAWRMFWCGGERTLFTCTVDAGAEPAIATFSIAWTDASGTQHRRTSGTPYDALALVLQATGADALRGRMRPYRGEHFFGLTLPAVQAAYRTWRGAPAVVLVTVPENPSGCARCEPNDRRVRVRSAAVLTSSSAVLPAEPAPSTGAAKDKGPVILPLSMRFRQLRAAAKRRTAVLKSSIQGLGLFATEDIEANEMCIEYIGELVGNAVADKRERVYERRGIGCYMFRVDWYRIVDATFAGNTARFINHSCAPNCTCRIIHVDGEPKIVIFAKDRIPAGTELTYDYQMPYEDAKIPCRCGARTCRGFMN